LFHAERCAKERRGAAEGAKTISPQRHRAHRRENAEYRRENAECRIQKTEVRISKLQTPNLETKREQ